MSIFRLPDIGEGLHEAEIVIWHVGVGDHVVADQPLVSIETDKAVVEIPAPESGHIARVYGEPGDIVAVGAPLVEYTEGDNTDSGSVVGQIPVAPSTPAPAGTPASDVDAPRGRMTPLVRALATRLGVDLGSVVGTGPQGTITRDDVQHAADPDASDTDASDTDASDTDASDTDAADTAGEQSPSTTGEPLRGVRRSMAANMAKAHAVVVPATVTDEADLSKWPTLNDITVRLLRAVGVGCRIERALNVAFFGADKGRRFNEAAHVGLAVDTADGLFVAVVRDAGNRDLDDLRAGVARLQADVIARSIPPAELRGATITLSNVGTMGGRHAALVVVPPQVAIIGAGRVRRTPVAVGPNVEIHPMLPLSLTFDHRAVTGGEATRFLMALIADLEAPT
jgi:pyruvate dehydrogenase E2 component (dihydrolipoamide acetyltransferase)